MFYWELTPVWAFRTAAFIWYLPALVRHDFNVKLRKHWTRSLGYFITSL